MYDLRTTAFERRVRRTLLIVQSFSTHPLFMGADLPSRGAGALPLTRRALQHEAQRRGASLRLVKGEERNSNVRPRSRFQGLISDFFLGGGRSCVTRRGPPTALQLVLAARHRPALRPTPPTQPPPVPHRVWGHHPTHRAPELLRGRREPCAASWP